MKPPQEKVIERPVLNRLQMFSKRPVQRFLFVLISLILPTFYLSWHLMLGRQSMGFLLFFLLWLSMTEIFCFGFIVDQGTDIFRRVLSPELLKQLRLSETSFQEVMDDVDLHLSTTMIGVLKLSIILQLITSTLIIIFDFYFSSTKVVPPEELLIWFSHLTLLVILFWIGPLTIKLLSKFVLLQIARNGIAVFSLLPRLFSVRIMVLVACKVSIFAYIASGAEASLIAFLPVMMIAAAFANFFAMRLMIHYNRGLQLLDWEGSYSI